MADITIVAMGSCSEVSSLYRVQQPTRGILYSSRFALTCALALYETHAADLISVMHCDD